MSLNSERARQVGTIGGLRRAALHDPAELAKRGQAGLRRRLLAEVDPDGQLDDDERERRLQRAIKAHMLQLALRARKVAADGRLPVISGPAAVPPPLDKAGIFRGETAEALADMEYAVIRDPALVAVAQAEMAAAMQRVIDSHSTASSSTERRRKGGN